MEEVIPTPKKPQKLPIVFSPEEVRHFLRCVASPKHRTVLTTGYAAGLRISEAIPLKPAEMDSRRMVIRLAQGQGQKDRYVMLSPKLLEILRNWWRLEKPKPWLFPSNIPGRRITRFAGEDAGQEARRASGISKPISPHSMRHAFAAYLAPLLQTEWVVYAKPPFGGPEHVLNYRGRYPHRMAISNNRLLDIDHGKVCFRWKDYRDHNQQKMMTLEANEFIRRFLLQILPDGFQRIRHYGFPGHRYRQAKLALCRQLLGVTLALTAVSAWQEKSDYRDVYEKLTGQSLRQCPVCHRGQMVTIPVLSASDRAPPFSTG